MPIHAAARLIACWADPVVVGPGTALEITGFAAVSHAPANDTSLVASVVLGHRDSEEERILLPGETASAAPQPAQERYPGKRVVSFGGGSLLGLGGLGLSEGVWDSYVEVAFSDGPTIRGRLAANRVDRADGDYSATRALGDPRYQVYVTVRERLSIDVRADGSHVEVVEVWVRPDHLEVLGSVQGLPVEERGPVTAVARRRSDGAELTAEASALAADTVTLRVPFEQLARLDTGLTDDQIWDLRLVAGPGLHQLRFAGLLDDIRTKKAVMVYPWRRASGSSVRAEFDARNDLVINSTRAIA